MKVLYAHAAHDLRLEPCAALAPGSGEVAVKFACGRICGSELHEFNHGGFGIVRLREPIICETDPCTNASGFGIVRLREPIIQGQEVAGEVVTGLVIGDLVAVLPSRPRGACGECLRGQPKNCLNMWFNGCAKPVLHTQRAFRDVLVADVRQCVPAHRLSPSEAVAVEPLAVCLHAERNPGDLLVRRVLVSGYAPIGVLVILAAYCARAAEIIAIDIADAVLRFAEAAGADPVFNTQRDPRTLSWFPKGKDSLDVHIEGSGLQTVPTACIAALCPRCVLVQPGPSGDMTLLMLPIAAKELLLRCTFRYHEEFAIAIDMMHKGLTDVNDLITHSFSVADFRVAFAFAFDRTQAMKVQLEFT